MELNHKELAILKILVQKELSAVQEDFEAVTISNSPVLGKVEDDSDIEFIKSEAKYEEFLAKLLQKL